MPQAARRNGMPTYSSSAVKTAGRPTFFVLRWVPGAITTYEVAPPMVVALAVCGRNAFAAHLVVAWRSVVHTDDAATGPRALNLSDLTFCFFWGRR